MTFIFGSAFIVVVIEYGRRAEEFDQFRFRADAFSTMDRLEQLKMHLDRKYGETQNTRMKYRLPQQEVETVRMKRQMIQSLRLQKINNDLQAENRGKTYMFCSK